MLGRDGAGSGSTKIATSFRGSGVCEVEGLVQDVCSLD